MWAHLPVAVIAGQMRAVADGGYPFQMPPEDDDVRCFFVDGEDMAEGQVEQQLRLMAPALRPYGLDLQVETVHAPRSSDDVYVVMINDRRCRVWGSEDWAGYRAWETATTRPLAIVNDLLAAVGAPVRLFTLYAGGNDGVALLLDPRVVAAVQRSGLVAGTEIPSLAVDALR